MPTAIIASPAIQMPMRKGAKEKKNIMKAMPMHIMANSSGPSSFGNWVRGDKSLPHLRQNLEFSGIPEPHAGHFTKLPLGELISPTPFIPCPPDIECDNGAVGRRDTLFIRQVML